ncbi:hypothetical protein GQR58_010193 [Nymphon striatum]|nr:hypothetical protein GQR58_010193 [Nymphon striatum]
MWSITSPPRRQSTPRFPNSGITSTGMPKQWSSSAMTTRQSLPFREILPSAVNNGRPGLSRPAMPSTTRELMINSNESSYSALKKMILSDKKKHIIHTSKKDGRDIKADGKVFILSMLVCKKLRESDPNLIILEEEFMHGGIYFVWQKNLTVAPILKRTSGYLVEKIGQCPTQYGKKDPRCELEG